jgi:MarR family transcriptional regulator, organic hydroperoxide resistance regulator
MAEGRKRRLRVLRGYDGPPEGYGHAAVVSLVRVHGRMTDAMARVVKEHGVTLPHFDVLLTLRHGEGISQQDLSERMLMTKGNVCVMAQKLELAGLIERRSDPTDQRFHRLYLTDAGRRVLAKVFPEHKTFVARMLSTLSLAEQRTLHELLNRVDQTLDDLEA